ncbi:MAG: NAD(P)H-hydrate dehydratase [Clostridia bacterium]|nr:NAD(P)H-hydrate dehydratase [Clostridia bacterium]
MNELLSFEYTRNKSALMPKRAARSSKRDFGRVLCVCGSRGMAGAAYFASKAAYRVGAGLVEILTPEENRVTLQGLIPEAIVTVYSSEIDRASVETAVERADSIVIGCGLGISGQSRALLAMILRMGESKKKIIDADALNILSKNRSLMKYAKGSIITPHIGEMARLTGTESDRILADVSNVAAGFAKKYSLICVLKDHNTAVCDSEGRTYINKTGNSGMATGGSGDVLAGIIGGILAQEKDLDMFRSAALGVYLHGLAGDLAAAKLSEYSVMASDIIDELPNVFK